MMIGTTTTTPMLVTLGAATDPETPPDQLIDGYWLGLAKRSFQVA
jgi:4,5-DOPA dioxygenase extradiol